MTHANNSNDDEVPSIALTIITEHSTGFPGETLQIDIEGDAFNSQGDMAVELVNEMGLSIEKVCVVNRTANLTLPLTTKLGGYSLKITRGNWSLDSIPFEIVKESVALLIRKLLLASKRQAEAFEALQNSDINLAVKSASEALYLYRLVDEQELAAEICAEFANALKNLARSLQVVRSSENSEYIRAVAKLFEAEAGIETKAGFRTSDALFAIKSSGRPPIKAIVRMFEAEAGIESKVQDESRGEHKAQEDTSARAEIVDAELQQEQPTPNR